jgi:glutamyl-tRNA synthetase
LQEAEWLSQLDTLTTLDFKALDPILQRIDTHLLLRTFIVGYSLSTPDLAIWGALRGNRVAVAALKKGSLVNFTRWYRFLEELCPWTHAAVESMTAVAKEKRNAKAKEGASYDIALKGTENGVVTRFPPEPS